MRYEFDWDPLKAASNVSKHRITFDEALTLFVDPLAVSILDRSIRDMDERWITIGMTRAGRVLLVVHKVAQVSVDLLAIRIISARKPTRSEMRDYEEGSNA